MNEPKDRVDIDINIIPMDSVDSGESEYEPIIKEIISLERQYFFEKRNVKTERQRKLREIIERHMRPGEQSDDT